MDLNPLAPQDPQEGTSKNPPIDLGKILLPKKETPGTSINSAQRINAGALLESEQGATLKPEPEAASQKSSGSPQTFAQQPQAPASPAPKKEPGVRSLETYQGDIEQLVENKNVSVVSIAAAEAARRGGSGSAAPASRAATDILGLLKKAGMILGGVVLLAGAAGALAWVLQPPKAVDMPAAQTSPFIKVDETKVLTLPDTPVSHADFIQALAQQQSTVSLSLGLIERLYLATASTTPQGQQLTQLSAPAMLALLSPNVPDTLLRAIDPNVYLIGVHSYDSNQPLIILQATSYEAAYAAMLAWEPYMQKELSPFFMRTPQAQLSQQSTATSTASSTVATSTPPAQPVNTGFRDSIIENHDVRVIEDTNNNILLLWTFLDRKTLVITTNDATLREVISRLSNPPIEATP